MTECRTTKLHTFNAHPVLEASFDLDTMSHHRVIWSLPRDSRELLVDPDRFRTCSDSVCAQQGGRFSRACDRGDPDEMLLAFCSAFEKSLRASTVSTDGEPVHLSRAFLGRCKKPLFRKMNAVAPLVKQGRCDDFQSCLLQPSWHLRSQIKQLRRLNSLLGLLRSVDRGETKTTLAHCEELWRAILSARGFHQGLQPGRLHTCVSLCQLHFLHVASWMSSMRR